MWVRCKLEVSCYIEIFNVVSWLLKIIVFLLISVYGWNIKGRDFDSYELCGLECFLVLVFWYVLDLEVNL